MFYTEFLFSLNLHFLCLLPSLLPLLPPNGVLLRHPDTKVVLILTPHLFLNSQSNDFALYLILIPSSFSLQQTSWDLITISLGWWCFPSYLICATAAVKDWSDDSLLHSSTSHWSCNSQGQIRTFSMERKLKPGAKVSGTEWLDTEARKLLPSGSGNCFYWGMRSDNLGETVACTECNYITRE